MKISEIDSMTKYERGKLKDDKNTFEFFFYYDNSKDSDVYVILPKGQQIFSTL